MAPAHQRASLTFWRLLAKMIKSSRPKRHAVRPIICALIVITGLSGSALAQKNTSQPPPPDMSTTQGPARQAPVGHRQPTTKDLPADVLQNEQKATPRDNKKEDKSLTICKGC